MENTSRHSDPEDRIARIKYLREDCGLTFKEIGKELRISRQYVGQLYGKGKKIVKRMPSTIMFNGKKVYLMIPDAVRVVHRELRIGKEKFMMKSEPYVDIRTVTDDICLIECSPQKAEAIMELWNLDDLLFRKRGVKIVTDYL